jgi:hypothetical protein
MFAFLQEDRVASVLIPRQRGKLAEAAFHTLLKIPILAICKT